MCGGERDGVREGVGQVVGGTNGVPSWACMCTASLWCVHACVPPPLVCACMCTASLCLGHACVPPPSGVGLHVYRPPLESGHVTCKVSNTKGVVSTSRIVGVYAPALMGRLNVLMLNANAVQSASRAPMNSASPWSSRAAWGRVRTARWGKSCKSRGGRG